MERLLIVMHDLSLARTLEQIMEIVRGAARSLTQADGASFVLQDNGYCYYADEDSISPLWKGQWFPMETCIGGWAIQHRSPAVIPNVFLDERIPWDAYKPTFVKSLVMVPIRTLDPIGAIGTYWSVNHEPTVETVKVLQALADTTAVAMENVRVYAELEQRVSDRTLALQMANEKLANEIKERQTIEEEVRRLSITDELTGLYNRRGFFLLAQQQLKLAQRLGTPYHIFFIDLDGLKLINDTQGHEMGDVAIRSAATILQQYCRSSDTFARLGGDEFAAVIQGSADQMHILLERIQTKVAQFNQTTDYPFILAMSIGIYPYEHYQPRPLEELLRRADDAMYSNKKRKQQ